MTNKFAERLTYLRKKRHWSQKETAQKLCVSQALLSHYEKGIRECGLDFVIKVSEIFGCSTDFLLGITDDSPESGTMLDCDNIAADLKGCPKLIAGRNNGLQTLNLLYSITARLGNPKIHTDFNNILYSDLYILLRVLESCYFKDDMFSGDAVKRIFDAKALNTYSINEFIKKVSSMDIDIDMTKNRLSKEYPISSDALTNIISIIEKN